MSYKRPTTEVTCAACGKEFQKENREIKKTEARNGVHCCNRECAKQYNKQLGKERKKEQQK